MVRRTLKPKRADAACCRVEVMNGGGGRVAVFLSTRSRTTNKRSRKRVTASSATASLPGRKSLPFSLTTWNRTGDSSFPGGSLRSRSANASQYSSGVNARISRSRSTTSRTATDCTRPADSPRATFDHSNGDSSKPTTRSRKRRACWALTRFSSILPGFANASSTAFLVIWLNTTRR